MRLTTLSLLVGLLATAAVVSAQDEQDCCAIAKAAMEGGGNDIETTRQVKK